MSALPRKADISSTHNVPNLRRQVIITLARPGLMVARIDGGQPCMSVRCRGPRQ